MKDTFNEFRMPTSRWGVRAVTPKPFSFDSQDDMSKDIAIIIPGWRRRPEVMAETMLAITTTTDMMPIAVDLRFGYADKPAIESPLAQKRRVESGNPFFEQATAWDNRYRLRKATALLALMEILNISEASLIGHSDGGRVAAEAAIESTAGIHVPKLILANAVGIGEVYPLHKQIIPAVRGSRSMIGISREVGLGALEGFVDGLLIHPRRTYREKTEAIDGAYEMIWPLLDRAHHNSTDVSVFHAIDDGSIDFTSAASNAALRPSMAFTPTIGGHSNIYKPVIARQLASRLTVPSKL